MCNMQSQIELTTVADLSHTGKEYRRLWWVDDCIADIVKALDDAGIKMRHSCCGHGKCHGDIRLDDGPELLILDHREGWKKMKDDKSITLCEQTPAQEGTSDE